MISRRHVLKLGVLSSAGVSGRARAQDGPRVVVVGAGFGGLTFAKYLRRLDAGARITVVEPNDRMIMAPLSTRVICGAMSMKDISRSYVELPRRHNLEWVQASAVGLDPAARKLLLSDRSTLPYDKLVVSPGIDVQYDAINGMATQASRAAIPHAWIPGAQTLQLREQLHGMRAGGVVALHVPKGAIRARPAAYERAGLVAQYLQQANKGAKVLLFDANPAPPYGKGVLLSAWKSTYGDMIEYVPDADIDVVDAPSKTLFLHGSGRHAADVLNIVPPQTSAKFARLAGLNNVDGRWCGVKFIDFESTVHRHVHVLGDCVAGVDGMAKTGQIANQSAKICASAMAAAFAGRTPDASPVLISVGYTYVTREEALRNDVVFRYDGERKTFATIKSSAGSTTVPSAEDGLFGMSWAMNIFDDVAT